MFVFLPQNKQIINTQTKTRGHEKNLGGDGHVCYLDCGGGNPRCMHISKLIKLHIINMYSLSCINYTPIKL